MVRSWERDGWSGGKLDLVWTFMICIDDSVWFLKAWLCVSRFPFWWFSEPLLVISLRGFETLLFGIWWGMYAWTIRGSFPFDSPPKSVSKGARFWGFLRSRVRGVFGEISSFPLDLPSFGGPNHSYGMPMRYSYYPKVLCESVERIGRLEFGFGGVDSRVAVHPESPGLDRCDRCLSPVWPVPTPWWVLLGWTFGCVSLSLGLLLFRVWSVLSAGGWFIGFGVS
jgi:hypothetical protein